MADFINWMANNIHIVILCMITGLLISRNFFLKQERTLLRLMIIITMQDDIFLEANKKWLPFDIFFDEFKKSQKRKAVK